MTVETLLQTLACRGIELKPEPSGRPAIIARPASRLTDEDRAAIRAHKPQLLTLLAPQSDADTKSAASATADNAASEALAVLARLKGYTLPCGRMAAARATVERLRPLLSTPALDPAAALDALQAVEAELSALGGVYDLELANAIGLVNGAFPGTQLQWPFHDPRPSIPSTAGGVSRRSRVSLACRCGFKPRPGGPVCGPTWPTRA